MIKKYKFLPNLGFFLIFFVLFSLFLKLGLWQIARLNTKNHILSKIQKYQAEHPAYLNSMSKKEIDDLPLYSKVSMQATILPHNILLYGGRYGVRKKNNGYYFCSAVDIENKYQFLINRGWVDRDTRLNLTHVQKPQYIEAILLPYEKKNFLIPDNKHDIWFTIDSIDAKSFLKVNVDSYYLLELNNNSEQFESVNNIVYFRNNHLEYAITWFLFALISLIIYLYLTFAKTSNHQSNKNQ